MGERTCWFTAAIRRPPKVPPPLARLAGAVVTPLATTPNRAAKDAAKIYSEEESVLVLFEVAIATDKQPFVDPEPQLQ